MPRLREPKHWRTRLAERFGTLAVSRRLPLVLSLLTMGLVAPSLFVGFQLDDYIIRLCGLQKPGWENFCPSPFAFFTFARGDAGLMHRMIEDGFTPWWAYEKLSIDFFRPLTGLTHWLDYRLWPDSPIIMHAESIAWLGGAVYLATLFYRGTLGVGTLSAAAAFAFAVDHVHGVPASWLANRNAVLGGFFGSAALVAYHRSRRTGGARATWVGVGCLLLGLLAGEIALGAWGYLVGHAVALDRAPVRQRLRALLPYAGATLAWRVVYNVLGHGARGSEIYLDPVREPLGYLKMLPGRLVQLVLGLFGFPPAEGVSFGTPSLVRWGTIAAAVFTLAVIVAFRSLVAKDSSCRFFAVGTALSLLPAAAAAPHNRLLYFPSLGAIGLLAWSIDAFLRNDAALPRGIERRVSQGVVMLSGGLHTFVSPLLLPLAASAVALTHTIADRAIPSALATMSNVPEEDLVMVNTPEYYTETSFRLVLRLTNRSEPARQRVLSAGPVALRVRRVDGHSLDVAYAGGVAHPIAMRLYRSATHPMKPGDQVDLDGLSIRVTAVTDDGRPESATFRFREPLDSPRLKWVVWQTDHFVRFVPPAKDGETVDVAPAGAGILG